MKATGVLRISESIRTLEAGLAAPASNIESARSTNARRALNVSAPQNQKPRRNNNLRHRRREKIPNVSAAFAHRATTCDDIQLRMPMQYVIGRVVVVRRMRVLGLEEADAPGQRDAGQERDCQPKAVVRMECHLRQEIGQRDAQENARRERERTTNHHVLTREQTRQTPNGANRPQRT